MRRTLIMLFALAAFGAGAGAGAKPAAEYPVARRAISLPPPVDLTYVVRGSTHGIPLMGTGVISWSHGDGQYALHTEARSGLFGKVVDQRSEGLVDEYGLAPVTYYEKRIRKDPTTTRFDRNVHQIEFEDGKNTHVIRGGEQDRSSVTWQLTILARATPEKFTPGSEWTFYVAGRKDGAPWTFRVVGNETMESGGMGGIKVLHFVRKPVAGNDQDVDVWLAPGLDWYPARILFKEENGDSFEQVLEKVNRK